VKPRELFSARTVASMCGISVDRLDEYRERGVATPVNVAERWIYGADDIVAITRAEQERLKAKARTA
jgi:hypothetical protein